MNIFSGTKQQFFKKNFFGFDIETYDNNKKFLLASIVGVTRDGKEYEKVFYSPDAVVRELKCNRVFRNSVIFATNLSFDFFGTFFGHDDSSNFHTVFRGSDLLFCKTYFSKFGFSSQRVVGRSGNGRKSLTFIDSLNYAKMSVKQMGDIIGFPKFDHPSFIGGYPQSDDDWDEMVRYNIRDSWVTFKFMKFLIESFEHLGATFKYTIASTSLSLFKNKYLGDTKVFQPDRRVLLDIFKAYYGGRTEAFQRGYFENVNYYDFNSLYPSVMYDNVFPDPNSMRVSRENNVDYINRFEGVSHVVIDVPNMFVPPLPVRMDDGKVVFPCGRLKGWYSHVELREAERNGCVIRRVSRSIFYTRTMSPFRDFISDLYNLRLEYKRDGNPMQLVTKLFMNSLYGKFGEKFEGKRNTIHESVFDSSTIARYDNIDRVGEYFVVTGDDSPKAHCIPIWAVYTSAYGRIKMFHALRDHDTIYCDTDSLITRDSISTSSTLGDLKLEMRVREGITVRPKFYAIKGFEDGESVESVKIKGLAKRLSYLEFFNILDNPIVYYEKFSKFKESLRRDFIPNEVISVHKEFSLEDSKRDWGGYSFDSGSLQRSSPLELHMTSEGEDSMIDDGRGVVSYSSSDGVVIR